MILMRKIVSLVRMKGMKRSTEFLKDCMADALLRLMKEKPFEKITIDEITKTAGVGRATYFRNFSGKNEVLTYKIVKLWHEWVEAHGIKKGKQFSLDNNVTFFEYNYSIKEELKLIYNAKMQSAIYDAFTKVIVREYEENSREFYKSNFYAYGLFGILEKWIERDFYESPEEMGIIARSVFEFDR